MTSRRRSLLEGGWRGELFSVTLAILNKAERLAAAQVIQANLAEVGITVEIEPHDSGTFWSLGAEKKGDTWKKLQLILDRFSMEPDPSWATLWFTPEQIGVWNWERFNSKEFGELNKQAVGELDTAKRSAIGIKMQKPRWKNPATMSSSPMRPTASSTVTRSSRRCAPMGNRCWRDSRRRKDRA